MADKTEGRGRPTEGRRSQPTEGRRSQPTDTGFKKTEAAGADECTAALQRGDLLAERYKVIRQVGQPSGEAFIYLCHDNLEKRDVIIKLYLRGIVPNKDVLENLTSLNHPDIIKIYSFDYYNNQFYEVMEYAAGGSLADRAKTSRFTEDELTRSVLPEVINALEYLHSKNIIHRDIKPENMFYRDADQSDIVVGDFGLSKFIPEDVSVGIATGALTPDFAAPEIFGYKYWDENEKVEKYEQLYSRESDYYALGMSLWWLYLGKSPFGGKSGVQIMANHVSEELDLLFPVTLSERHKSLLSGLLVKIRKKRWGASEIRRWMNGENVSVYKPDLSKSPRALHGPFKLRKATAETPEQLAVLLQTYEDEDELRSHLGAKHISQWLGTFKQVMALDVEKIEEKEKNTKIALLTISCILDPNVSYFLAPDLKADTPKQLAGLMYKNRAAGKAHFQIGRVAVWLKYRPGGANILNRWNTYISGKGSGGGSEADFESFIHCLDAEMPEADISIAPAIADLGTVESIANKKMSVKITNTGSQGLFSCGVQLGQESEGVKLNMKSDSQINMLPNQSVEIGIEVDATVMAFQNKYVNSIVLTKNIETFRQDMSRTIEIPLTFYVDIPAYSKKVAKRPLKVS